MTSNAIRESITLNNRQYAPVYLIQNSSLAQGRSYVLSPAVQEDKKPVTSNLKLFYENSGSLENGVIINNVQASTAAPPVSKPVPVPAAAKVAVPAPSKVQETVGNNLKLASFLVPKKDATKQQYIATISNKILTPKASSADANILPNVNIISNHKGTSSKKASSTRTLLKPRLLPKIKPKENIQESSKHTAVHLLKLGGTYHSLNQLSDEQLRLVNQALEKIHNDPGDPRDPRAPARDPGAKDVAGGGTRVIYKIVSASDLKLVGKNKLLLKGGVAKKEEAKVAGAPEAVGTPEATGAPEVTGGAGPEVAGGGEARASDIEPEEDPVLSTEVKVTRSGRAVKLPRHIQQTLQAPPPKAKKKIASLCCFHCSTAFTGMYRLQRHYERNPTHLPSHTHTNLFHCLLAVTEGGGGAALVQQLQALVTRLRAVLPCLLRAPPPAAAAPAPCSVPEDVARLFGITPGTYSLNVDALNCTKDKEGYCSHSPKHAPVLTPAPVTIPVPVSLTSPAPEVKVTFAQPPELLLQPKEEPGAAEGEDCARVHAVDGWALRREWKRPAERGAAPGKRVKAEPAEPLIELGTEFPDVAEFLAAPSAPAAPGAPADAEVSHPQQFYSAHFDIRSSPIKPSAAVFSKFHLSGATSADKFCALKPLAQPGPAGAEPPPGGACDNSLDVIIKELSSDVDAASALVDNIDSLCKEADFRPALSYDNPRDWTLAPRTQDKPNGVVFPGLLLNGGGFNFNESASFNSLNDDISDNLSSLSQGASVLQFLDSLSNDCLPCPETELRNNPIDFQLDLFSFNPA